MFGTQKVNRLPQVIFPIVAILVMLTSCAQPAAPTVAPAATTAPKTEAKGKTSITFLTPPWAVVDETALKAWEDKTGISVETISVPNEQVYQKVQVANAAQTAPADVIFLSEEAPSYIVTAGALEPLDAYIAKDGASMNLSDIARLDFWKRDGKQYGITSYLQIPMLDYNSKRLSDAGYNDPPKTWDEFMKMAQDLKSKGVDNYPVSFAAISWSWYLTALPMGEQFFDDNLNPTFNAPGSPGRKAMQFLYDLYKEGLISPEQLTQRDPHAIFEAGVGTLHQSWLGAHAVFNNPKISKQAPNVKYALLPEQHWTWGFDSAIGISKYSNNKDAAWEFIKYYEDTQNQRHLFDDFGLVPARESVVQTINAEGKNQQPDIQDEQSKYVRQFPRYESYWGQWDSFVTETIRQVFQGQFTPDQGIDKIAEKWKELKAGG